MYNYEEIRNYVLDKCFEKYKVSSVEELMNLRPRGIGFFLNYLKYNNTYTLDILYDLLKDKTKLQFKHQVNWHTIYDDLNIGKCKICNKETKYINIYVGFYRYCSRQCSKLDPELIDQIQESWKITCFNRYGVVNYFQLDSVKEKSQETSQKNWGTNYPMQNEKIIKKMLETNKNNHNGLLYSQTQEFKKRFKETSNKNWGTNYPMQNKEVSSRSVQTNKNNHNGLHSLQTEEIKKKIMNTTFERYGKYMFITPRFSLQSKRLFESIERYLSENTECYFATNGDSETKTNEHQVVIKENEQYVRARFLDFYIPELNKCIEFDESHHKNQIEEDLIRENEIKSMIPDIEILRISIEEYNNSFDNTLTKCLEFLNKVESK